MQRLDEQKVLKGLECCISQSKDCEGCPYVEEKKCGTMQRIDALALIRNKNARIKVLEKQLKEAKKECSLLPIKIIDAVKSKASRNACSYMASGVMREIFTIRGRDLDEIEKSILGGDK